MKMCPLCFKKVEKLSAMIFPLLNDPVVELCTECLNEFKISQNLRDAKESVFQRGR